MKYRIQPIGKEFSNQAIKSLEERLNAAHAKGYRYHSVIEVQQPGCGGFGTPSITYLAVFEQVDAGAPPIN
ncbi:hypothetical protein [uncultured Hyphomonas sp.]|jgi:hypothetical protein|uniref:hypothetical protein n=1 Tax=uncultured Hyphomonas sp. TaxID=225298 RepID=UPI000C44D94C|nr:hypothetical protein [Hyphomonadaceae bacterium]MBA28415.1 hypothetical protein [Hyphomonadaceae bacterium]MBL4878779.1 hypothetical protein [Hyphomonas sp.]|tara:strand:+ start:477 stop:689 length:213 start_codon:yes stop_codon:yes gene_type:complete